MLSAKEKRFVKYWEEQRTGGRWSYFALYIPVGTFLCSVLTAFLLAMFTIAGQDYFIAVAVISLILSAGIIIPTWYNNEKKFKKIIHREVTRGKLLDEKTTDDDESR